MNLSHYKSRRWLQYKDYSYSGDWHVHTNWTDGHSSIEECFSRAEENHIEFIVFSEHVRKKLEYNYLKFKENVYTIGAQSCVRFAVGAETKVLDTKGTLDISEATTNEADIIHFAFHSPLFKTKDKYIEALCHTIRNPAVDVWAHPTSYSRHLDCQLNRDDWSAIFALLREESVAYEINKKYDIPTNDNLALAAQHSVDFVFGSDAHRHQDLLTQANNIHYKEIIKAR